MTRFVVLKNNPSVIMDAKEGNYFRFESAKAAQEASPLFEEFEKIGINDILVRNLTREVYTLEQKVEGLNAVRADLNYEIKDLNGEISDLTDEISELENDIKNMKDEIEILKSQEN